jgi:hypothetical protein
MGSGFAIRILRLVILVAACAIWLTAQELATLHVTVTDQSGGVIPQALVTLRSIHTSAKRTEISSAAGLAVIAGLAASEYELTIDAPRFSAYKSPIVVRVGQTASFIAVLSVEGVKQQVEVRESVRGVDSAKSEASQVIDPQQISDLPIAGRDFIDFVLLTPTTNVGRSTAVGSQSPFTETVLELSFGGLRETHSSFFALDGVDYTTSISGVQRVSPSQDWVQEFRVVSGAYTADYGRNLGSVVNTITKSGGNETHGSLYEYFRNNALDATNLLAVPGFNTLRSNQFGADAGGPIRKNKNFYFVGYEGQRRAESPIYSSFILHCIDTTGCLGPGSPSINQVKQELGLQPENLGSILELNNYDKFIAKSTNVLTERTTLNAAYLFNDDRKQNVPGAAPGQGLPSSYRNNPVLDQTAYANVFHIFTPHLTSETLVSVAGRTFNLELTGAGYEPSMMVPDLLSSGGFQGSVRFYRERHIETAENLTYVHGNHTFGFGGNFEPVWISAQTTFMSPGFGVFTPQSFFGIAPFCGPPCGPFGPGTAVQFLFLEPRDYFGVQVPQRTLPFQTGIYSGPAAADFENSTDLNFRHELFSLYGQDAWKVRPNLTLTFGLRYDIDFMPSASEVRIIGKLSPANYGNVQPRIGVAYSFREGKGVVRAGFGLFTGPFDYSDVMVSWQGASAFTYINQPLIPAFADPANNLVGFGVSGIVGASGPALAGSAFNTFAHTGAYPTPGELLQFPLGYSKLKFENAYAEQASLEIENEIAKDTFISVGYQFIHALKLPIYSSINGVPSGIAPNGVQLFTPADTNFGFTLYVTPSGYSNYNAGIVSFRKNFAHYYSVLANYTISKSLDLGTDVQLNDVPMDYLNPGLDRAVSDNDVRQRFVLTALAQTPTRCPVLFRNFTASMLTTLQSPLYYTILAGFDVNGDQFPFNGRVGGIGRNTYRGDPSYTTDIRLQRLFNITERFTGDVSFEVFNLFNRSNVNAIDTVYGAANFAGPIPHYYGDGVISPDNPTFGTPTFVAPARQIQLSLRVNF